MYILGISCYYHDSAACIVKDGEIIAATQEERFTRKKHDESFPTHATKFCLESAGIDIKDVSSVVFYDKPFLKFERILESYLWCAPKGLRSYLMAIPTWLKKKLWIPQMIANELKYDGEILFAEHHQSHAASAFYPSPFDEAAILTVDGVGEWATTSWGVGSGNSIQLKEEIHFPHSLGLLYSAFTYYTGFKVNSGEYKVMGLAPYGEPKYAELIYEHIIDLQEDGSFHLNMKYFDYVGGLTMTNHHFDELFGAPAREPESKLTQREMDLAASVQAVTEEVMLRIARHVRKETGLKNLCLAGGVALNCVANGKIVRENIFDDVWIQPASGDAGGALGSALLGWYEHHKNTRIVDSIHGAQGGSYFGPKYSESDIKTFLTTHNLPYKLQSEEEIFDAIANLMIEENVIGWFDGSMEFGPRALGARSIIGDARSPKMQEIMNLKIKFRESFRPFAPSVLEEHAHEFFDISKHQKSPYMLLTTDILKEHRRQMTDTEQQKEGIELLNVIRSKVPAVTHVDYSARLQTVSKDTNPRYHKLISAFYKKTEVPIIINTSFNVRGEPIVCTPEDAYKCFMRTNMDYLVLGNFVLTKTDQPEFNDTVDWEAEYELD